MGLGRSFAKGRMAHYWFAFDIGAYEDSTAHLTMLQDGAYNRLLRHYYKTGKAIPKEMDLIQRISGAHSGEELEAVSYILNSFFRLRSDGYHNKRADNELLRAKEVSKLRKELGKKGGLAKARANDLAKGMANGIANRQAKPYTVTVTDTYTKNKEQDQKQQSPENQPVDHHMATQKVFLDVGLAGTEARMLVHDAVEAYVHAHKCDYAEAAEGLIASWQAYESAAIEYKKGVFKFFKEGLWKSPEQWATGKRDSWAEFRKGANA
jgi:uncharacterized protein YdaU (DUF1376 family)